MTATGPFLIAILGVVDNPGGDAVRKAREWMMGYATDNHYRVLDFVGLTGDTRADVGAYERLEVRARASNVRTIVTWGQVNSSSVRRLARTSGAQIIRLDLIVSARTFPYAYFSLSANERLVSSWARSIDRQDHS